LINLFEAIAKAIENGLLGLLAFLERLVPALLRLAFFISALLLIAYTVKVYFGNIAGLVAFSIVVLLLIFGAFFFNSGADKERVRCELSPVVYVTIILVDVVCAVLLFRAQDSNIEMFSKLKTLLPSKEEELEIEQDSKNSDPRMAVYVRSFEKQTTGEKRLEGRDHDAFKNTVRQISEIKKSPEIPSEMVCNLLERAVEERSKRCNSVKKKCHTIVSFRQPSKISP